MLSYIMSERRQDTPAAEISTQGITRRDLLTGVAKLGTAAIAGGGILSPETSLADGGETEAPANPTATAIAEYEQLSPDELAPFIMASPRFKFSKDFPPQNQSFRLKVGGAESTVYLGKDDDPMTPFPHLGITSPLNPVPNEGSWFRFSGKLVGDIVGIPFRSEDPSYHEDHGKLTAHFAPMGFADGDPLTGEISKGVLPVFLYFTGEEGSEVPWVNRLAMRQTLGPDTIFDGREGERTEHQIMPLTEIISLLNDAKNNTIISMQLNGPILNKNLYKAYKDIGWPTDLFEEDYMIEQAKKISSLYRNTLQRHSFVMAKRQGYSLWAPLDGSNVDPVPFNEIFTDKYKDEDPEVILDRLPKMETLLSKEEVTAEDLLRIPPATMLDLITINNSLVSTSSSSV